MKEHDGEYPHTLTTIPPSTEFTVTVKEVFVFIVILSEKTGRRRKP